MSNTRIMGWSTLAIALFSGIFVLLSLDSDSNTARMRNSIIKNADVASKLTLSRGADSITLEKARAWRIIHPFSGAADQETIKHILDLFAFSGAKDVVLSSELERMGLTLEDFGLSAPKLGLSLTINGEAHTIKFGDFTPAKDGVYAAISGVEGVAIIASNTFASVNRQVDAFREHNILPVTTAEISGVDIKRGSTLLARIDKEAELWKMLSPRKVKVSDERVKSLIEGLTATRANSFAWPTGNSTNTTSFATPSLLAGYGLDSDSAVTVSLRNRFGNDAVITLGNDDGNGNVYVLAQNSMAIVTVDAKLKARVIDEVNAFIDSRLFPYTQAAIDSLRIVDGDEVYIVAKDLNGVWRLDAPFSANADDSFVQQLVDRLINLRPVDADESGLAITIGKESAPTMVSRIALLGDNRLIDLRSREIMKVELNSIKRLVAGVGPAKQSVVYDLDRKQWSAENVEAKDNIAVDADAINRIVSILSSFNALRVESFKTTEAALGGYGLERPQYILAVDRNKTDSIRRNILIGDKTDDGYYVTVGASDAVFVVDAAIVEDLMKPLYR